MPIVTLNDAKLRLGVLDSFDDMLIEGFISAAIGMVENEIQKELYQTAIDVPESSTNVVIINELKETKKQALFAAIYLSVSTLYSYRESDIKLDLSENPAFKACLSGFSNVYVG